METLDRNGTVDNKREEPAQKPRYRTLRRSFRRGLLAGGIYLGFGSALAWITVRPKPQKMTVTPALYKMPFENVSFTSADRTRLAGWYVPAQEPIPHGAIILCHGVDSDRQAMLEKAVLLHRRGYTTLLFDFRARGESGGKRCTLGFREVDDLLAAVEYLRSRKDARSLPIGVFGESLGGAVALMGTARCLQIRAVAAESPFARLDHAIENNFRIAFGFAGPFAAAPARLAGERMIGAPSASIAPVEEIGRIAPRPMLLIQDGKDRLCPAEETRLLLEAAGEPKTLWTVPHADHIEAQIVAPVEFARRVTAFFDKALRGIGGATE